MVVEFINLTMIETYLYRVYRYIITFNTESMLYGDENLMHCSIDDALKNKV